MPKFEETSAYLRALKKDPSLAVISFQMAADGWNVSRAAIDRMARGGKLERSKSTELDASGPRASKSSSTNGMNRWRKSENSSKNTRAAGRWCFMRL